MTTRTIILAFLVGVYVVAVAALPSAFGQDRRPALIELARQTCPWVPAEIPRLSIVPDAWFDRYTETDARLYHAGAYVVLDPAPLTIVLRESHANERMLCHEWSHAVEGHWHH